MVKKMYEKKGSALIIAIIIMMVTMMLAFALLLISFSLHSTANRQNDLEQCKEIAQSLSVEIENEIVGVRFEEYEQQRAASEANRYPLWFYLRYNLGQTDWPYLADEKGHTKSYAYRYFNIFEEDEELKIDAVDDISILMYYERVDENLKGELDLTIQVICTKGKQKCVVKTLYSVSRDEVYEDVESEETEILSPVNPGKCNINLKEKWEINFSQRE